LCICKRFFSCLFFKHKLITLFLFLFFLSILNLTICFLFYKVCKVLFLSFFVYMSYVDFGVILIYFLKPIIKVGCFITFLISFFSFHFLLYILINCANFFSSMSSTNNSSSNKQWHSCSIPFVE
jgi:hypothetical protein